MKQNSFKSILGYKVVQNIEDVVEHLSNGQTIARFEFGGSMMPILKSGEYCILTPLTENNKPQIGDAVFCCVQNCWMTHMVWNISNSHNNKTYYLIGSSSGELYGWTSEVLAVAKGTNIIEEPNFKNNQYIENYI